MWILQNKEDKQAYYLYVLSNDVKICQISLSCIDSNNQSAEMQVQINVLNWASKDWLKWTSQYQEDWVKWKENYRLGLYGVWYFNTIFFPNSFDRLFDIWGLIILISLATGLLLVPCTKGKSLYSIEYIHVIIIIVVSGSNQDLIRLVLWVQTFKFDFGFLDQIHLREFLYCSIGSDKMMEVQFYWQSTLLNYFYLLSIWSIIICLLLIINKFSKNIAFMFKIHMCINSKLNRYKIAWILIHIFFPFLLINLLSDALNASNHVISSLTSFVVLLFSCILLMIKYQNILSLAFVKKIDDNDSSMLTFITILKSITHALLYHFRDSSLRRVLLLIKLN